uniref:Uncharacterized protein n=1 Tax=Plectus sambesii TaxID=2011161 RepID=A0A914WFG1_9BILA
MSRTGPERNIEARAYSERGHCCSWCMKGGGVDAGLVRPVFRLVSFAPDPSNSVPAEVMAQHGRSGFSLFGASVFYGELLVSLQYCSTEQIINTSDTQNYFARSAQLKKWQKSCNRPYRKRSNVTDEDEDSLKITIVATAQIDSSGCIGYANEERDIFNENTISNGKQMDVRASSGGDVSSAGGGSGGTVAAVVVSCIVVIIVAAVALFFLARQKRALWNDEGGPAQSYEMLSRND